MRFTTTGLLILAFFFSYGQTCSIDADSIVCKNELLSFTAVTTGTATSFSWDFGDGGTSNVQNISHSYSSYGTKIITLTVGFSGGGSCVAKDTIKVHDLPVPSFSMAGSEYCFSDHEICLTDNSTMGNTTSGYDKRIILWGDGANNTENNPSNGDQICYDNYSYPDTFEIVIEVTNDKGCEAIWREDVVIEHEHIPSFTPNVGAAGCTYQNVCLNNDSTRPDDVKSFLWYFGDGTVDSTSWSRPCHGYPESKQYTATFTVELENGCTNTSSRNLTTAFQEVDPGAYVADTGICFPLKFQCINNPVFFANYYWYLINTSGDTVDNTVGQIAYLEPPEPGTYYVAGRIKLGDCDTTEPLIKVESLGIEADFKSLNNDQCKSQKDTLYTVNRSKLHPTAVPDYIWAWYDTLSPSVSRSCSTARNNCYWDTVFENSKHFYEVDDCYYPTLIAHDITTGCIDSFTDTVSRLSQDFLLFEANVGRPCLGGTDNEVPFSSNLCGGEVFFNPDTTCYGPNTFYLFEDWRWPYGTTCDSNGYISPAFITVQGDSFVYRSADSTDFYVDNSQICIDTLYYPDMFQLFEGPKAGFSLQKNQCLPIEAQWSYNGDDSAIAFIQAQWNDPPKLDSFHQYREDFPEVKHTYTEPGTYSVSIYLEDTNGCFVTAGMEFPPIIITAGYFNTFTVDSVICPGQEFVARDSILYWYDGTHYWRNPNGPETVVWDFGEGDGFSVSGTLPKHVYEEKGVYTIRMATQDKNGCRDTVSKEIVVGGVNAVIMTSETEFLCDQIVQFKDSSWSNLDGPTDTINSYYWNFGDGTNISKLKNPFHFYDQNGYFTLTHAVSNAKGCSDTVSIEIYMRGPQPYFDIISDTAGCAPFEAEFELSGINISEFILHLGDNMNSTISSNRDTSMKFTYKDPGVYDIYLAGTDSFFNQNSGNFYTCTEWFPDSTQDWYPQRRIWVLPTPPADFSFQEPVCPGVPFDLTSTSDTAYKFFSWQIDTSYFDSAGSPVSYTFQDTGTYDVTLYPFYDPPAPFYKTCFDTISKSIEVSYVRAGFTVDEVGNCSGFAFLDSSDAAVSYSWDFGHPASGDSNTSDLQNPTHTYTPDTGIFEVCLTVTNQAGCVDTYCEEINPSFQVYATAYNVFTPGSDGKNDFFAPRVEGEDIYDLKIFNRWGELVFQSNTKAVQWDGTDMRTGEELPAGTYFYIFKYRFECTGEEDQIEGMVEMIR
ncbi:PKD domain-containing protein [bacterium]|nr:PKD domain-containing protein [bacterium]